MTRGHRSFSSSIKWADSLFPSVQWDTNDRALSRELITILEDNVSLKRAIWPGPGEAVAGISKETAYEVLTRRLLNKHREYSKHLHTQEGNTYYMLSVKAHLWKFQDSYKKAKERLGVTATEIMNENVIWRNWDIVKDTCPYFFRLRGLLEERLNVSDDCITNSAQDLPDIDELMTGKAQHPRTRTGTDEMRDNEDINNKVVESYTLEDTGQGTSGLTRDDSIHPRESVSGVSGLSGSAHFSLVPRSLASDTKDTLRWLTETKNQRKRQRDTECQIYPTERLRLTHEHEMEMKRMEIDARAAELHARAAELELGRAHERWMKECDLGLHGKHIGKVSSQASDVGSGVETQGLGHLDGLKIDQS